MHPLLRCVPALALATVCAAKPPADLQTRLDAFMKGQSGGAAVAWVDADGATYFTTGKFSASDNRPIASDTVFEIGSVSKVFTALLLAETERAGKASRNDPAAKYLLAADDPGQPTLAKITLLSLVTHNSGLPRLPVNLGNAHPENPYANYDRARLIGALRTQGPDATPDRSMTYSNFGVAVLGEALASAWGLTYPEALQLCVLDPLGMKSTSVGITDSKPPEDLAPAHALGKIVPNWTFQAAAAAGGIRSTAHDMATFLGVCLTPGDSPLHVAIEATLAPQTSADETGGEVALGWLLTDDPDLPVAWHNGATAGSRAFVAFSRKSGEGVAILTNNSKPPESFGFSLLGAKPPQPSAATVPDATSYTGRYPLSPTFAIDITEVRGGLYAQATGQSRLRLRQAAANRFAVIGVPAEIVFERDADGKIIALTLKQNGADQRGPRQDLPPPVKEIALPAEVLQEYVGSYALTANFALAVTEDGGALFVQATGQPRLAVFASAKDEFFYKAVDAHISFHRSGDGKVTDLILRQGGQTLAGAKSAP